MIKVIDRETVATLLDFETCIPLMRDAMIALSRGEVASLPRQIIPLEPNHAFGVMVGALTGGPVFGSKLVSVFPDNAARGLQSHQGVIALFDAATGAPTCLVHAGEITAIRTAAASAAATDVLARKQACRLAVLGYGEQAKAHVHAIATVRPISTIVLWGRDADRRASVAVELAIETGIECRAAPDPQQAVADADIICTTTAAAEPILQAAWVAPGTHVNVVGSSRAGPTEVDSALVVGSRYFADCRDSVLAQGSEFLVAKAAALIDDSHIVAEIGEVFTGAVPGRTDETQITLYKSLGHIVQDLASAHYVEQAARRLAVGSSVAF